MDKFLTPLPGSPSSAPSPFQTAHDYGPDEPNSELTAPDPYLLSIRRAAARMALSRTDGPRYRVRYQQAGQPYGPSDDGLVRWLQETVCERLKQAGVALGETPKRL